jgi:hypothetical protein
VIGTLQIFSHIPGLPRVGVDGDRAAPDGTKRHGTGVLTPSAGNVPAGNLFFFPVIRTALIVIIIV